MKGKNISQTQLVLHHLMQFGSIEPITALHKYGCYRLGAVIFRLRAEGYNIVTERLNATSKITGRRVLLAKYILL